MSPGRPGAGPGGGGKLSRRAALLLLGGGALTSLTATGAFSSVSGPRRVDLGTANDDEALLALTSGPDGSPADAPLNAQTVAFDTHDGGEIAAVEIGNNLGEPVDITSLKFETQPQDPNSTDLSVELVDRSESIPSTIQFGASKTFRATVTCENLAPGQSTGPVNVELSVTAEGASTSISLERTVTVNCRNCVPCDSGTDELVKYEWVSGGSEEDGEEDGEDSSGSFQPEGTPDSHIELTGRTLDSDGEPVEACFAVDYCNVDVVVKAATEYETYENQTQSVCVTAINGHAISNIRFFCDAPDDVTVGGGPGGDDDDDDDDGDDGGRPQNPGNGNGSGGDD